MPVRESAPDDQQLVRYLLQLLPEEESERLDELTIVDDDAAARLRDVENDLVDAYVAGSLDPGTRRRFDEAYLTSAHRRQKVEFARRFLSAVDGSAGPATGKGRADGDRTSPGVPERRGPRLRMSPMASSPLLIAAALLLIAAGVVLVRDIQSRRGRNGADRQLAEQSRQADNTVVPPGQSPGSADVHPRTAAARPDSAGIVLLPQTRSVGEVPGVTVPPQADRVRFDLRLESNDFRRYQVSLRDPGTNSIVWRSAIVEPRPAGATFTVSIVVPGDLLKLQHYTFELAGLDAGGRRDVVGSYAIQVDR